MLAKGNGQPELCALNLFRIIRGEVPYDRIKGRNGIFTDSPSETIINDATADAEWLLETYEPRVETQNFDIDGMINNPGEFGINISLKRNEGE